VYDLQKKDDLKMQIEQFLADEPTACGSSKVADTATDVSKTEQDNQNK